MKFKIKYSRYSASITAIIIIILAAGCVLTFHEKPKFFILLTMSLIILLAGLMYGVTNLRIDRGFIILGSPLRKRKIRLSDIQSAELLQPTMGIQRIIGSGGFMGYWGIFREGYIGRYYAFYAKASDCFLIRLRNGDKYLLGCTDPAKALDYIQKQIPHT